MLAEPKLPLFALTAPGSEHLEKLRRNALLDTPITQFCLHRNKKADPAQVPGSSRPTYTPSSWRSDKSQVCKQIKAKKSGIKRVHAKDVKRGTGHTTTSLGKLTYPSQAGSGSEWESQAAEPKLNKMAMPRRQARRMKANLNSWSEQVLDSEQDKMDDKLLQHVQHDVQSNQQGESTSTGTQTAEGLLHASLLQPAPPIWEPKKTVEVGVNCVSIEGCLMQSTRTIACYDCPLCCRVCFSCMMPLTAIDTRCNPNVGSLHWHNPIQT